MSDGPRGGREPRHLGGLTGRQVRPLPSGAVASFSWIGDGSQVSINGLELSTEATVWFHVVLFAISLGLVVAGALAFRGSFLGTGGEVVVTPTLISVPCSDYSHAVRHLDPTRIRTVSPITHRGREVGVILGTGSDQVRVMRGYFQPQEGYPHCVAAIRHVVAMAQQPLQHGADSRYSG